MIDRLSALPRTPIAYLFATLVVVVVYGSAFAGPAERTRVVPSPSLDPAEIVRIQVQALRANGPANDGIAVTYRFASPGNKNQTGPLARFTRMVRSAPYHRLLNHRQASYSPIVVSGDEASQMVMITTKDGTKAAFLWVLSRQAQGEWKDCWMTDSVLPIEWEPHGRTA